MHPIERFYRQYRDDVYRYLLGLARDPNLAEDLLSETFLEALRALPAFRREPDGPARPHHPGGAK